MPHDKPEAEAVQTTRRTFLARAALGGALVTVATAGPLGQLLPAAAQGDEGSGSGPLDDAAVAAGLAPLELAAVRAYEVAARNGALDLAWTDLARRFQTHHQTAADLIGAMSSPEDPTPVADPTILASTVAAIGGAGDQGSVLSALAEMEETIAATHLWALGLVPDQVTARLLLQVQATEAQQAVVLGRETGRSVADLTPATGPVADGLPNLPPAGDPDDAEGDEAEEDED